MAGILLQDEFELALKRKVTVFLVTTQLDTRPGRAALPTGDVVVDVFDRPLDCPLSSRSLEEAVPRLQARITSCC